MGRYTMLKGGNMETATEEVTNIGEATDFRLGKLETDRDNLSEKVSALENSCIKIQTEFSDLLIVVKRLETATESLKAKPGDKWDKIVYAIISTLVAAAIAYFIGGQGVG